MRWPPTQVPFAENCAPWFGQRKPLPLWFTVEPACGQIRESATYVDVPVRTIASGLPWIVTIAIPPTEDSAG